MTNDPMPTYHFHCRACAHDFALKLTIGSSIPSCPTCKSSDVQKVIVPPMIHFKGSGFYRTDSTATSSDTPRMTEKKEGTKIESKKETSAPVAATPSSSSPTP